MGNESENSYQISQEMLIFRGFGKKSLLRSNNPWTAYENKFWVKMPGADPGHVKRGGRDPKGGGAGGWYNPQIAQK